MTLTIIAVLITAGYTIALCRAAAHTAHPGWMRKKNTHGKRLARLLAANAQVTDAGPVTHSNTEPNPRRSVN